MKGIASRHLLLFLLVATVPSACSGPDRYRPPFLLMYFSHRGRTDVYYKMRRERRYGFATACPGSPCPRGRILETFDDNRDEDPCEVPGWIRAVWYGWDGGWPSSWNATPGTLRGSGGDGWFFVLPSLAFSPDVSDLPWSRTRPVRWQLLLTAEDLGSAKDISDIAFPVDVSEDPFLMAGVHVRLVHTAASSLGPDLDANLAGGPPVEALAWRGHWYFDFPYNGRDNVIVEIEHYGLEQRGWRSEWTGGDTGMPGRTAWLLDGHEAGTSSFAPDISFGYRSDRSAAQSLFFDTGVANPRFLAPTVRTVPEPLDLGQSVTVLFQGADVSGVPVTDWVEDPAALSGHRFVRFRVLFTGKPAVEEIEIPFVWD